MAKKPPKQLTPALSLRAIVRTVLFYLLLTYVVTSVGSCILLRWMPPLTSMFMLHRHVEDFPSFKWIDYRWVSAEKISPHVFTAVIASEDQRFLKHFGFDLNAISASIEDYMDGEPLRGASTISQQVAKNLFLTPSKNFIRKGVEVWFTGLLEIFWSKQRIIEVYLNIAEFGDHLFGIEAASQHYFGIPAKQLSRSQAALLAATLPNPIRLKAASPSNYVLKRRNWILRQMPTVSYLR
ncbi:MAG: monofunctional biosynthetic peptidoglycan transglycosylase [Methylococcaceae bacterium]|nr:monofunctional biosynthetic peptidoglycan transglycosylase [Methylococcaceae bacterium]MDD1611055.1 monofunctional biosynthetic peptidoglycan transglycosylase [Methylococcaceae bacterium]